VHLVGDDVVDPSAAGAPVAHQGPQVGGVVHLDRGPTEPDAAADAPVPGPVEPG